MKVSYLVGYLDKFTFRRILISSHSICDIFLFLNDYEDWKSLFSEDMLWFLDSWDVCHEQAKKSKVLGFTENILWSYKLSL